MPDLAPAPIPSFAAVWPTTPRAFADTTLCPRCFAFLPSSRCVSCGLELAVPLASDLIVASNALVDAERRRRELIDRMWSEQLAAQAYAEAQARTRIEAQQRIGPDAAAAAAASVAAPPFPAPEPVYTTVSATPGRSGVQVFLLVAGIVLLSVFALFFLTVAYLFATVEVRVIVTALAGLAAFGVAWVLTRRRLPATAEGVGVAGAAILVGTLGFVRGAELFGSASIEPTLFIGVGLLVVAAFLAAIHSSTALRFARIGSLLLMPTGVALLVIGTVDPLDSGLAWWAALVAAGASTLLVRQFAEPSAEAALVRSIGFSSLTAALVPAALLLPGIPASSAVAYSTSALVWGGFVLRLHRQSRVRAWSGAASVLIGLSISLAPAIAILRDAPVEWNLWAPGAATGLVAVVFAIGARRSSAAVVRRTLAWAQGPALFVSAVGLVPGVGLALLHTLGSLIPRHPLWQASPGDAIGIIPDIGVWAAVLAPGIAAVLGAAAIRLTRVPLPVHALVGSLAGLALLAAASHAGSILVVLLGYLLVALVGLAVLLTTRRRHAPAIQAPTAVVLGVATLALVVLSHASSELWLPAILAAVGLIIAARYAVASDGPAQRTVRALLTALAVALLFGAATLVVPWLSGWRPTSSADGLGTANPLDFAALPGAAAALLLCVTPLLLRLRFGRVSRGAADLRAASIVALPVVALSSAVVSAAGATSTLDHLARIAIPLALATAGILWQMRFVAADIAERVVLSFLTPIAIALTLSAFADATGLASAALGSHLAGPVAAILSATVGALLFARATSGLHGAARIAWGCSTGLVILVVIALEAMNAETGTWLILLLLSVAPFIAALSDGNPFAHKSLRRYFFLPSFILAIAALWQFLGFRGVSDVEPYTLPVAGLLLSLAAATAAFGYRSATAVAGRSVLFAAGLIAAVGASALAAAFGSTARGVVLLVICAALVAAALVVPRVVRGILVRDSTLLVSLTVLVVVGCAGTVRDAGARAIPIPELWVLPAALALIATSVVWTRRRALPFRVARFGVPAAITLVGLAALVGVIALPETSAPVRIVLASVSLAAVAVGAAIRRRVPLDRVSQYTALSLLVVIGIAGFATSAAQPFELSTAPLALALIASGIVAMIRNPAARSWPTLGPGLAVLLVPSLLADFGHTELWRVILLGALSVAVTVVAIALRWQAPLVVGAVVLIMHALAQSWPWIQGLYSAVPWWIWLGVAGVLLIAVAARYEHRVRNLRSFVGSIAALR